MPGAGGASGDARLNSFDFFFNPYEIEAAVYRVRNAVTDGRVFFESPDPLVPQDTNSRIDVYEWEDGQPHLISSGQSDSDSRFVDASASGDDIFF